MVVKMIKWPLASKKFQVKLVIKRLEGLVDVNDELNWSLTAQLKWKGLKKKKLGFGSLRGVKKDQTSVGVFDDEIGAFCWDEEFRNFCSFSGLKDCGEIVVTVVNGTSQDVKNKALIVGTVSLNLSEYVSSGQDKVVDISLPLTLSDGLKGSNPLLMMSLSLIELKFAEPVSLPVGIVRSSSAFSLSPEKERVTTPSVRKERKTVNLFKGFITSPKHDRAYLGEENGYQLSNSKKSDSDTESVDDMNAEGISDEEQTTTLQPLSYGPLTFVNLGHSSCTDVDDWVYYSHRKPHADLSLVKDVDTSAQESFVPKIPKHRFLSWRKRKLGFRSTRLKGEPLLKKDCRDEGGDDIDFDRRQVTSSDESSYGWRKTEDGSATSRSSFSEFEDEVFTVGLWEKTDITCRDGHMKLETQVFFASMDQRSERAAGESACASLVAVIADWLRRNSFEMPNKSEFDSLIRDGSSEWRNMCESQVLKEKFPDRHFDLETVLEAKIRPISVIAEKSYIGFFHPDGILEESFFDILHGSMSFDEIWDEISRQASECDLRSNPLVYIVSWNDHFFVLKVEQGAYYIVDTLGERLFEGTETKGSVKTTSNPKKVSRNEKAGAEEDLLCSGKESCKEYIKSFLAAIPMRQLESDIKKGRTSTVQIHQRLQIEFHFADIMC